MFASRSRQPYKAWTEVGSQTSFPAFHRLDMCTQEYFGNLYRGCGCFDVIYNGQFIDCRQPTCGNSSAHTHQGWCQCNRALGESRRVINLFRQMCDVHAAQLANERPPRRHH